jgi:hypothetical protein
VNSRIFRSEALVGKLTAGDKVEIGLLREGQARLLADFRAARADGRNVVQLMLMGMGKSLVISPLLVLLFGVPPATAVGTDLLYAAMTKAGGTVAHGRKGHIDWAITGHLADRRQLRHLASASNPRETRRALSPWFARHVSIRS